jgi:hypothetical protein
MMFTHFNSFIDDVTFLDVADTMQQQKIMSVNILVNRGEKKHESSLNKS